TGGTTHALTPVGASRMAKERVHERSGILRKADRSPSFPASRAPTPRDRAPGGSRAPVGDDRFHDAVASREDAGEAALWPTSGPDDAVWLRSDPHRRGRRRDVRRQ